MTMRTRFRNPRWSAAGPRTRSGTGRQRSGIPYPRFHRARTWAAAALAATAVVGCDSLPIAMGDVHAIIVTASPELWGEVGPVALSTLGSTVFTVRDENTFRVTYEEPTDSSWAKLRRLRQLLLIGKASDPWMAAPLAELDDPPTAPTILQVREVWGRQQLVTLLVLEEEAGTAEDIQTVLSMLPELSDVFDSQYRDWVVARMFATGPDTALARSLAQNHGFTMVVPQVYDYTVQDSVHIFRNDNPDPTELIRQFAVTWRTPIPASASGAEPSSEILQWRASIVDEYYDFPQVLNDSRVLAGSVDQQGLEAYTVQAVWENPPDAYPAAGPFIARTVDCPAQDRRYLVDSWLYAPSRDKYEYMIQIAEILDSFRCAE